MNTKEVTKDPQRQEEARKDRNHIYIYIYIYMNKFKESILNDAKKR